MESYALNICFVVVVAVVFYELLCCRERAKISLTYRIIVTMTSPSVEKSRVMPMYSFILTHASFIRPEQPLNTSL